MAKLTRDNIPFTQVVNELANDKTISFRARGIYAYMFGKPDDWDFSTDRMADETDKSKEGRKAVLTAVKELEKAGWLIRKKQPSGRMEYHLKCSREPESHQGTLGLFSETKVPSGHSAPKARINNKDIDIIKPQELPDWLNKKAWEAWMAHRKEIGKKQTPTTVRRQLKLLSDYRRYHVEMIDTAIRGGWTAIYPPKGKENLKQAITEETPVEVAGMITGLANSFKR